MGQQLPLVMPIDGLRLRPWERQRATGSQLLTFYPSSRESNWEFQEPADGELQHDDTIYIDKDGNMTNDQDLPARE